MLFFKHYDEQWSDNAFCFNYGLLMNEVTKSFLSPLRLSSLMQQVVI